MIKFYHLNMKTKMKMRMNKQFFTLASLALLIGWTSFATQEVATGTIDTISTWTTDTIVNDIGLTGIMNGIDTSTLVKKIVSTGADTLYVDKNGAYWSESYLNWNPEKIYNIAPQDLKYTTVMNLKLEGKFNDFIGLLTEVEANRWEKHLTRIQDRFWVRVRTVVVSSRENNPFDEIFYSITSKNEVIDFLLVYIQDEKKFYAKALDALKIDAEIINQFVGSLEALTYLNSEYVLNTFKSRFLKNYLEANPDMKKYLNDEEVKLRDWVWLANTGAIVSTTTWTDIISGDVLNTVEEQTQNNNTITETKSKWILYKFIVFSIGFLIVLIYKGSQKMKKENKIFQNEKDKKEE